MADVPFWYDDPVSWDNVFLGGEVCPGIVNRIENLKAGKRKLDSKTAPGTDGASYVDKGYEGGSFTIVCVLSQPQELRGWADLVARLRPKKKANAQDALSVVHPQLAIVGIDTCFVVEVSGLEDKAPGLKEGKLSCVEFLPLKSKGTGGSGKVKTGPDLRDATVENLTTMRRQTGHAVKARLPSKTITPPKP